MSRFAAAKTILAAADEWKQRCLLDEGSLFSERSLWIRKNFEELDRIDLEDRDPSLDSFQSLERQLQPTTADAKCLWAEMAWVKELIASRRAMGPDKKRSRIRDIWRWSGRDFPEGQELLDDEVLGAGVVRVGAAFNVQAWHEYGFFVDAMLAWFSLDADARRSLLGAPWDFASWLDSVEDAENRMFRHALLFLLFPDEFEPIIAGGHKKKIVGELYWGEKTQTAVGFDQAILELRRFLERHSKRHYGGEEVHFYRPPFVEFWKEDRAVRWFKGRFGTNTPWLMNMDVNGEDMWRGVTKDGVASIGWDDVGDLHRSRGDIDDELVEKKLKKPSKQWSITSLYLWHFANEMAIGDIIVALRKGGKGLLGWGIVTGDYQYNVGGNTFRKHTRSVEWQVCDEEIRQEDIPLAIAGFNTKRLMILEGKKLRWLIHIRMYMWLIGDHKGNGPNGGLHALADSLHLPIGFLQEIETLLYDKKQIIFQGPPGTGKTYVAQKLAKHLARSSWPPGTTSKSSTRTVGRFPVPPEERVTLVQLHPSYAYEDFVQGFRPTLIGGQPAFALRDGPLLQAAKRAAEDPDAEHFLVIDEINRGNVAKVFGELYFLLEYRDAQIRLQYSDEPFSLPPNLYVIGTMNTADRSIALVDLALRRRFYFVDFHPDEEPVKGVLRRWLRANVPSMEWVADVVEHANAMPQLKGDRHAAIGPSYFMKQTLDEAWAERIWKHSVLPYIEERLGSDAVRDFALGKLRGKGDSGSAGEDGDEAREEAVAENESGASDA